MSLVIVASVVKNRLRYCPKCGYDFMDLSKTPYILPVLPVNEGEAPRCLSCGFQLTGSVQTMPFFVVNPEEWENHEIPC